MKFKLRKYQTEAIESVFTNYDKGYNRLLIVLPTGTGKTAVAACILKRREGRSLILVNRDELLRQAVEEISLFIPRKSIGVVKAMQNELNARCVVASVQTLSRDSRLQQMSKTFETIIVDEAHHAVSPSFIKVLRYFGAYGDDCPITVGLTATPERYDNQGLEQVFQKLIYKKNILEMLLDGFLCDMHARQIKAAIDFSRLKTVAGDFDDGQVGSLMEASNAPDLIVKAYQQFAINRRSTLLFLPTVRLVHLVTKAFNDAGISAACVDGDTPNDERVEALARFKDGSVKVMINCAVLTEGYNMAKIDCVFICKPTRSIGSYKQMIGRGTRIAKAKKSCLILDLVGATTRFDLVTTASLFGFEPDKLEKMSLIEAHTERLENEKKASKEFVLPPNVEFTSKAVNIFDRKALNWLQLTNNRAVLTLSDGMLLMELDGAMYKLTHVYKGNRRVVADGLDEDYAYSTAEDFARESGSIKLVDSTARWRSNPVSPKQTDTMKKLKIPFAPNLNCGQASDLIAVSIASRQRW